MYWYFSCFVSGRRISWERIQKHSISNSDTMEHKHFKTGQWCWPWQPMLLYLNEHEITLRICKNIIGNFSVWFSLLLAIFLILVINIFSLLHQDSPKIFLHCTKPRHIIKKRGISRLVMHAGLVTLPCFPGFIVCIWWITYLEGFNIRNCIAYNLAKCKNKCRNCVLSKSKQSKDRILTVYWNNVDLNCIPEHNAGEHKQFPPFAPSQIKSCGIWQSLLYPFLHIE